jgi:hypothetical protein
MTTTNFSYGFTDFTDLRILTTTGFIYKLTNLTDLRIKCSRNNS